MFIKEIRGEIILDSRNERTIQIKVKTLKGTFVSSAPSGKSKGKHESKDYNEHGIEFSLRLLNEFLLRFNNKNMHLNQFEDLAKLEEEIKKYEADFGKLGANVTYVLEVVLLKAAASENDKELWDLILGDKKLKIPMPIGNCIGGGMHSKGKKPDFQEFLFIPQEETFSKAFTKMFRAYEEVKREVKKQEKRWVISKNDESAWQTSLSNEQCLEIMKKVADKDNIRIGIDMASSTFFNGKDYLYRNKEMIRDKEAHLEYINMLVDKFKLFYIEDPFNQEDFLNFSRLVSFKNSKVLIVGDDLTATHLDRVKKTIGLKSITGIIIKPNQNGSLIQVKEIVEYCKKNNLKIIFSHRSGETMDNALADLAIGFQADFVKTGIHGRERLIKLKRIIDIEKEVGLGI